jgi:hypothetical protein
MDITRAVIAHRFLISCSGLTATQTVAAVILTESAGALVRWSAGALVRWSAGALVRWCAGPLVRWTAGALMIGASA